MSDLYRKEALEAYRRSPQQQRLLDDSGWIKAAFRVMLAAVAGGIIAAWLVHVDGHPLLAVLLGRF